MTELLGFDTNILIYSIDLRDPAKHALARRLVKRCGFLDGVISLQCLTEFYYATTRKALLSTRSASMVVNETRASIRVETPTEADLIAAMGGHAVGGVQFFDALMLATIARAGCKTFFTEDLVHGSRYRDISIINPFLLTDDTLDAIFG